MVDTKSIKKELKNNKNLEDCACDFSVVGDLTRMKICWLLCKHPGISVSEIAEILDVSVSTASHSLRRLRESNLVTTEKSSRSRHYRLSDCAFNKNFRKILKTF